MMVSLSQTTMRGMKVNLPVGSSGHTQSKKDYISLSVDRDGYSYFDKVKIPLEEILPRLKADLRHETRRENFHPRRHGSGPWERNPRAGSNPLVRLHQDFVRDQEPGRHGGSCSGGRIVRHMAGPLLYRPQPRWQVWSAFGGALALHFAAVGIASIKPAEHIEDLSQIPEAVVELSLEQQSEPPQPTPPPEEEPPPPPPPEAVPEEKPEYVEEKATPPPKRPPSTQPVQPIARPTTAGPSGPAPSGKAAMIFKPRIQYPYEARRSKITGSGIIVVSVERGWECDELQHGREHRQPDSGQRRDVGFPQCEI